MKNWAVWRNPKESLLHYCESDNCVKGLEKGFIIAPFFPSDYNKALLTIPFKEIEVYGDYSALPHLKYSNSNKEEIFPMPDLSTQPYQHQYEINEIKDMLTKRGNVGKVVAATVKVYQEFPSPNEILERLIKNYPNAYIFMCYTPQTGILFGASPETLISCKNKKCSTMALAGTRKAGTLQEWDIKNIEEQEMVTQYICNILTKYGAKVELCNTFTKRAGKIEHICTPINFAIPVLENNDLSNDGKYDNLKKFLSDFSPTPALSGLPKEEALNIIKSTEHFYRGYYGGFVGVINDITDFQLFVNLRSGRISNNTLALYAGGGITSKSIANREWRETRAKFVIDFIEKQ